jgi:hypothetical protein
MGETYAGGAEYTRKTDIGGAGYMGGTYAGGAEYTCKTDIGGAGYMGGIGSAGGAGYTSEMRDVSNTGDFDNTGPFISNLDILHSREYCINVSHF